MVKKIMVFAMIVWMLTGCNSPHSSEKKGQEKNSSIVENDSNVNNESLPNVEEEQAKEESVDQQTLSPEKVIEETKKQLKADIPIKLPKTISVSSRQHLTAMTSSDKDQYAVMFLETDEPIPINNDELKDKEVNIATLKGTRFESAEKAAEQINHEDHAETGGHEVDLGYSIKGYSEGAAGSQYIGWNEGRWSLVIRGFTEQGESVVIEAKKVVEYLETNMLPIPHDIGASMLDVTNNNDDRKQLISWQEDNIVYEIETNKNTLDALGIAVSIQEN